MHVLMSFFLNLLANLILVLNLVSAATFKSRNSYSEEFGNSNELSDKIDHIISLGDDFSVIKDSASFPQTFPTNKTNHWLSQVAHELDADLLSVAQTGARAGMYMEENIAKPSCHQQVSSLLNLISKKALPPSSSTLVTFGFAAVELLEPAVQPDKLAKEYLKCLNRLIVKYRSKKVLFVTETILDLLPQISLLGEPTISWLKAREQQFEDSMRQGLMEIQSTFEDVRFVEDRIRALWIELVKQSQGQPLLDENMLPTNWTHMKLAEDALRYIKETNT